MSLSSSTKMFSEALFSCSRENHGREAEALGRGGSERGLTSVSSGTCNRRQWRLQGGENLSRTAPKSGGRQIHHRIWGKAGAESSDGTPARRFRHQNGGEPRSRCNSEPRKGSLPPSLRRRETAGDRRRSPNCCEISRTASTDSLAPPGARPHFLRGADLSNLGARGVGGFCQSPKAVSRIRSSPASCTTPWGSRTPPGISEAGD